jgi:hypothetical protein
MFKAKAPEPQGAAVFEDSRGVQAVVAVESEINDNNFEGGFQFPYRYTDVKTGQPFHRITEVAKGAGPMYVLLLRASVCCFSRLHILSDSSGV